MALISLLVFVTLALLVRADATAEIDLAIITAVRELWSPPLDALMIVLTTIGTIPSIAVPVAACLAWTLARRDFAAAFVLALVSAGTELTNVLLKHGFGRARPDMWPRFEHTTFAFPSGHAMSSVAVIGTLAVVAARLRPGAGRGLAIAAALLAFGIGFSRIYLGVHWPSDVLGGWSAGMLVLLAGVAGLRYAR